MRVKGVIMSLALHYWMRGAYHCSSPPVSKMTYIVSSGMLNSIIPISIPLFCVVSEIQCRKYHNLEILVKSQARSLKVAAFDIGYSFLLVFYSNFVPKMHCFWDIWLQICRDLENWVRGLWRSLKMSPFNRAHMTYYWDLQ